MKYLKLKLINMDLVEKYLGEAIKPKKIEIKCMECGHKFKKEVGPRTTEIKCPKCKKDFPVPNY